MRFDSDGHSQQYLSSLSEQLSLPKFQTAYADIEDRRTRRRRITDKRAEEIRRKSGYI
jgi:hypothetical protein